MAKAAFLIRARFVVQVHPGPPFKSSINTRLFSLSPFRGIYLTNLFANYLPTSAKPPRTITLNDSGLLCYAPLDESVSYTVGHGLFFVDGKEIGKAPSREALSRLRKRRTTVA
jgi:hypothetical protein